MLLLDFISNYRWHISASIILIFIILLLIHKKFLKILENRDFKKTYSPEKLSKNLRQREDDKTGNVYYGMYFWCWQKNKLNILYNLFPIGEYFLDKFIVTDVRQYSTVTAKFWSPGKRTSLYKQEFRVYYEFAENRKSVVNNFNHNGIGNQVNTVNQNENNTNIVINQLENLLNETTIDSHDKTYIESFIYRLSQKKTTKEDKSKIIDTLSKYTGVGNNVVAIIANVARLFSVI